MIPAEANLPALTSYLDSLSEPHIVFDRDYRIVAANAAYRREFAPRESILGRTCYEVSHHFETPCDQAGESCPLSRARESGQRERVLHLHHTPRGEAYVQIELIPLLDENRRQAWYIERMAPLRVAHGQAHAQGLIGRSAAFQAMLSLVARVGPSMASVLLLGESGTGKELVARAVHEASPRASAPLVVVDCASLAESLFESELFGHERGAFTGANTTKPGLVESASGGTLFLDEVGDIPPLMQVKLLRLLESGTFRRVGSTELRHADVRVVSATHRDLDGMVAQGTFRQDLYFRLCTFPIHLPALRERTGDITLLAEALLTRVAPDRRLTLTPGALDALVGHPYPGNVRELCNVLERAALLCDGAEIERQHIEQSMGRGGMRPDASGAPSTRSQTSAPPSKQIWPGSSGSLKVIEEAVLREQLHAHTGTRAELARVLGISERSLYRKLRALGAQDAHG